MDVSDWDLIEKTRGTAELQCMVLMEHDEKAGLFNDSRIAMAKVRFSKHAEGWTEKEGLFHPRRCHTCGSCMGGGWCSRARGFMVIGFNRVIWYPVTALADPVWYQYDSHAALASNRVRPHP